jgi:hypothetical protein
MHREVLLAPLCTDEERDTELDPLCIYRVGMLCTITTTSALSNWIQRWLGMASSMNRESCPHLIDILE